MQNYQVMALDMDGTVLDDQKRIGEKTRRAIQEALAGGKEVVFCTGRSLAEMRDYLSLFPKMHYLLSANGAFLVDLWQKKALSRDPIAQEALAGIEEVARGRDVMPYCFVEGRSILEKRHVNALPFYNLTPYVGLLPRISLQVEDLFLYLREGGLLPEKLLLFHRGQEDRERSLHLLEEMHLPLTLVRAELSNLECTQEGFDKGEGLRRLSQVSGIPLERMVMVGDADNDIAAMECAGLGVCMGNGNERARAAADFLVADNNHDGVAEAIRRFM